MKHSQFLQDMQALRTKIETSITKSARSSSLASLVQQYIERVRDYQKIFRNEQAELDQIKKTRRENIFPFAKVLELDVIELNKRILAATDPADKKILKKGLIALKEYAKEMKLLEKASYNIVLNKKELGVIQESVASLESKHKSLFNAIAKKNEKYFAKLAKARRIKKAKLQHASGKPKNNEIKQTVAKIKSYLLQYRKDMKEFDARFTQLKHEVHLFRMPQLDKKHAHLFKTAPQDIVMQRLASNSNAHNIMEKDKKPCNPIFAKSSNAKWR